MSSQLLVDLGGLLPFGEKKKILNQFINHVQESEVNNILRDCQSLPSVQYDTLKLRLAEKFRRSDLIIQLLYNPENVIVNEAVTKRWLYESDDSQLADSDFLINELFPNVSYNCRQKVLYRIGRYVQNVEKVDKIWNAMEEKYGLHLLQPLLQACSIEKIKSVISTKKVDLSVHQLLQILQKYFDVGLMYLKNHYANGYISKYSYLSPLQYIYENHPVEFIDLFVAYSNNMNIFKFGRGRSTKVIRSYRAKVLEFKCEFASILKRDRIRREFSEKEFQLLFESTLAPSPDRVDVSDMWKWVETVPVDKRRDLINSTYKKLFAINFDDHPEYMTPEYIMLLPDERRLAVVQSKISEKTYCYTYKELYASFYKEEERKIAWLPFKPINYAVAELQKLLLIEQEVRNRACLSKYLIMACFINQDLHQLTNVLTLLNKRSRNDQVEVRYEIFLIISNIMKKMEFTKENWDIIIEMIQVSLVFMDAGDYSHNLKEVIVEKCLAFHVKYKLPINNLAAMHIKLKIHINSTSWNTSPGSSPADEKTILELYVKELENLQSANDLVSYNRVPLNSNEQSDFIINLIDQIIEFNKRQPKLSNGVEPILIDSHEWLRNSLENIAKQEEERVNQNYSTGNAMFSWHFTERLINIIQTLRNEQKLVLDAFKCEVDLFRKILHCSPTDAFMYFLRTNPSELDQNWPMILSKMLKTELSKTFMTRLKFSNYSKLVAQSIKICTEIMQQKVENDSDLTDKQKCNAVVVLSILNEPSHFLELTAKFYPATDTVDVLAEKSQEEYLVRQTFAKSLLNVSIPHMTFSAIEKFCVGDYLKLIIGSLYSQICRASERKSLEFLQKHLETRVSLQKHIIRLYFKISPVEEKIRILQNFSSSNVTIRNEIFQQANKLLRSSPSQITWSIFKLAIDKTTTDDAPIILYMHSTPMIDTCPLEFLPEYVRAILVTLRKFAADKVDSFMLTLENVIDKIPEETLDDIINYGSEDQLSLNSRFCVTYLENSSSSLTLEHRLSNITSLLQKIIENSWDKITTENEYSQHYFYYPTRNLVLTFIASLCANYMRDSTKAWLKKQIFETILQSFKSLSTSKLFKEILQLELALMLVEVVEKTGNDKLRAFGQSLARYTDTLKHTFGGEIICIVSDIFYNFVHSHFNEVLAQNYTDIVYLIDGMLEVSQSSHNQMLSILFLKTVNSNSNKSNAVLDKINDQIRQSENGFLQIYSQFISH